MKTSTLILLCLLIFFESKATNPDSKKKILIVGFSNSYFTSNSSESIAQGNNTPEDSIFKLINHRVLETFTDKLNASFEYVVVEDARSLTSEVGSSIYYLSPASGSDITSIEINEADIKRVCEFYNADIVVFINSYEVNWEEEPYLSYMHTFDSEMFVKSGERVGEEKLSFMTDDVKLREKYSSKLSKQVSKILKKLERVRVANDAFVNK